MRLDGGVRTVLDAMGGDLTPCEWSYRLGVPASEVRAHLGLIEPASWARRYDAGNGWAWRAFGPVSEPVALPERAATVRDSDVSAWCRAKDAAVSTAGAAQAWSITLTHARRILHRLADRGEVERFNTGTSTVWLSTKELEE
ncbi:MAG: hypothetical protein GY772_21730 [bacterium]|nr:hypothetical protein [bacterium]